MIGWIVRLVRAIWSKDADQRPASAPRPSPPSQPPVARRRPTLTDGWRLFDSTDPARGERVIGVGLWGSSYSLANKNSLAGLVVRCAVPAHGAPRWEVNIEWDQRVGSGEAMSVTTYAGQVPIVVVVRSVASDEILAVRAHHGTVPAGTELTRRRIVPVAHVTTRYEADPAVTEAWALSSDGESTSITSEFPGMPSKFPGITSGPGGMIRKLQKMDCFQARVNSDGKELTATWDVGGLQKALMPLVEVCPLPIPIADRYRLPKHGLYSSSPVMPVLPGRALTDGSGGYWVIDGWVCSRPPEIHHGGKRW